MVRHGGSGNYDRNVAGQAAERSGNLGSLCRSVAGTGTWPYGCAAGVGTLAAGNGEVPLSHWFEVFAGGRIPKPGAIRGSGADTPRNCPATSGRFAGTHSAGQSGRATWAR